MKNLITVLFLLSFFSVAFAEDYGRFYNVVKGETLSKIALNEYGSYFKWKALHKWNKQITDPNWIYYGEKIFLPGSEHLAKPEHKQMVYTLSPGDTYKSISEKIFGLDKRWKAIAKWNNHRNLSKTSKINYYYAGQGTALATVEEPVAEPVLEEPEEVAVTPAETTENEVESEIADDSSGSDEGAYLREIAGDSDSDVISEEVQEEETFDEN